MSPQERVGSGRDARLDLKKAQTFYDTAASALAAKNYDPAVSNAVISGINAADVICFAELGRRSDNNNHDAAVQLLIRAGSLGQQAAPIIARLLPLKNVSQYRAALAGEREAEQAIESAEQLLELATQAAATLP
jgi:hypothetical protein